MRTARYMTQLVLGIVLPLLVQRWDRSTLSRERRARTWNGATWAAALYAFGPLSMLGWSWVSRRDLWLAGVASVTRLRETDGGFRRVVALVLGWLVAVVVGAVAAAALFVLIGLVDWLVALALGLPGEVEIWP
jgi:hypothetical protein